MDSHGGNERRFLFRSIEFRDVIAMLVLSATFAVGLSNLYINGVADIPDWSVAVVSTVIAFYFGERRGVATAVATLAENGRLDRRNQ